jgi:hypothetical protein
VGSFFPAGATVDRGYGIVKGGMDEPGPGLTQN